MTQQVSSPRKPSEILADHRRFLRSPVDKTSLNSRTGYWIGHIIRCSRRRAHLGQQKLRLALGFGMSSLSEMEAGRTLSNIERTGQVLRLLDIPAASLAASLSLINAAHRRTNQQTADEKPHGNARRADARSNHSLPPVSQDKS